MIAPRCGKRLSRRERSGGPAVIEDPECGRPIGHNGRCRSEAAVARAYAADIRRGQSYQQPCACGCGGLALWGHRFKRGHNRADESGRWREAA